MGGVVISMAERRLAREGIKITFFKVVIKRDSVANMYPGGLQVFQHHYQNTESKDGLLAVTFMSLQQVDQFVDKMKVHGIYKSHDLATANQIDGVVCGCEGIEFVSVQRPANIGTHMRFPVWYACAQKRGATFSALH